MDKQLIERMKAEVRAEMRSTFSPSVESFIDAYADRLIERIAAERGKEAVAWMHPNGGVVQTRQTGLERSTFTIPLFLSPTIPEGMALVPIEPTGEMLLVMQDAIHGGYDNERGLYAAIRGAAQGEK